MTIPEGIVDVRYDADTGQIDTMTDVDGGQLGFGYLGERVSSMEWDAGPVTGAVSATYDAFGRVDSITVEQAGTAFSQAVSYGYDDDGLMLAAGDLAITRDPVTGQVDTMTLGGVVESWTFNEFGEPASTTVTFGAEVRYRVTYDEYDEVGRLVRKTEEVGGALPVTFVYDYDVSGRLDAVFRNGMVVEDYAYESPDGLNDNRTSALGVATVVYDDQDRLLQYGSKTLYDYTANGELLGRSDGTGDATFTYDVLGNLRSSTSSGGPTVDYQIDAQNRRIGKVVDKGFVGGWLYKDGINPVAALDTSGAVRDVYVYGAWPHVPDYVVRDGVAYRYVVDRVGSVRLAIDASSGAIAAQREYDSFGNVLSESDPDGLFGPFGFAGGLHDRDTGFVRFGARDYDPRVGRWTAKDPSLFGGGQSNLYVYAANDPVNKWDLEGRFRDSITANPAATALVLTAFAASSAPPLRRAASQCLEDVGSLVDAAGDLLRLPELGQLLARTILATALAEKLTERCTQLLLMDNATCDSIERLDGPEAAAECFRSVLERQAACLAGRPLPPLKLGRGRTPNR